MATRIDKQLDNAASFLYEIGFSMTEVSEMLEVRMSRVRSIVNRLGVTRSRIEGLILAGERRRKANLKNCIKECGRKTTYSNGLCYICYGRQWTVDNRIRISEKGYDSKYGISKTLVSDLLTKQNGKCAICGTTNPGGRYNSWHVDHDHSTLEIRGILCNACNTGLGHFKDEPLNLYSAFLYLSTPRTGLFAKETRYMLKMKKAKEDRQRKRITGEAQAPVAGARC